MPVSGMCYMYGIGRGMMNAALTGVYGVSGILAGVIYKDAYRLNHYIQKMDDEHSCDRCEYRESCRALKPIGKESNLVTEFTYSAYCLVRRSCMHVHDDNHKKRWICMLILAILNSVLYMSLYVRYGIGPESILYSITVSLLIYIGYIDWNTQYIPVEFNIIIMICGIVRLILRPGIRLECLIGLVGTALLLYGINWIGAKLHDGNDVIGGGDIRLMAAAGLLLGWKLNIVAFMMGCICGSIIHLIIMKIGRGEHQLAFGPYLNAGIYLAMICGEQLMSWYLGIMGM